MKAKTLNQVVELVETNIMPTSDEFLTCDKDEMIRNNVLANYSIMGMLAHNMMFGSMHTQQLFIGRLMISVILYASLKEQSFEDVDIDDIIEKLTIRPYNTGRWKEETRENLYHNLMCQMTGFHMYANIITSSKEDFICELFALTYKLGYNLLECCNIAYDKLSEDNDELDGKLFNSTK